MLDEEMGDGSVAPRFVFSESGDRQTDDFFFPGQSIGMIGQLNQPQQEILEIG